MTISTTAPDTTGGRRRTISRVAQRLPLVAAAAVLPLVPSAPAFAADNVICVGTPTGTCNETAGSISAAIFAADSNVVDDTILVGPGTYDDGPYYLHGSSQALTLKGAGQGTTFITLPPAASVDDYIVANHATVQDLTIQMAAASSTNDTALVMFNHATATAVTIDGAGTQSANGVEARDSVISMSAIKLPTGSDGRGIFGTGGNTVMDSTISGTTGFGHSGPNSTDTLSRVAITASGTGIATDSGTVVVDDALIDLGSSSGTGLAAANFNTSTSPKAINANHVTIVGGAAGSRGAYAFAAKSTALQLSTIQLDNSIIRGPQTALAVKAGNDGLQGGPSTATITTSYSSWSTKTEDALANGIAQVVVGPGRLDVDPAFADAASGDYRLTPGSPVLDQGDPAAAEPTLDLDGKARVLDGDGNGSSVRDMGAYELYVAPTPVAPAPVAPAPVASDTVAPGTKFTSKPRKVVTKGRVKFRFRSNESGVTYECKLDKRAWRPCSSPKRVTIKVGKHRFSVRATDAAGNTDATPATYRFKRVHSPS